MYTLRKNQTWLEIHHWWWFPHIFPWKSPWMFNGHVPDSPHTLQHLPMALRQRSPVPTAPASGSPSRLGSPRVGQEIVGKLDKHPGFMGKTYCKKNEKKHSDETYIFNINWYIILFYIILYYIILHYIILYYILYYIILYCIVLHYIYIFIYRTPGISIQNSSGLGLLKRMRICCVCVT